MHTHYHAKLPHCSPPLLIELFLDFFYAHTVWSSICMSVPFNWISSNQNYSCLSLWKNKVIFFPSTMPGSLLGNQTVTLLAINYPELCHCFPSFIKPWTTFLPPVINSSHDDALHPMNQHKREIQTSGIDDKQWQEYLSRTFNWKQSLLYKMNSKVIGLSYISRAKDPSTSSGSPLKYFDPWG